MNNLKRLLLSITLVVFIITSISFVKKSNDFEFVYPNGTTKALIMSYDDGPIEDIKLAKLFDKYGIIGTFNLNSGYLGTTKGWAQKDADSIYQKYIPKDSVLVAYKNHEIASHSTYHKDFKNLKDEEILQEVETDIANLNKLTHRKIKSFAYPFGNSNPHIANIISHLGLTNARTIRNSYAFNLPDSLFLWHPTCHDSRALELLDKYKSLNTTKLSLFCVWGHGWEFKDAKRWNDINTFCKEIGNRNDIWYVGAGTFIDYEIALKALTKKNGYITNPKKNKSVWFKQNGKLKVLKPGKRIKIEEF